MAGSERDNEPKPFGKGAFDGDLGPSSRAGRIRVLEGLATKLEIQIQPVLDELDALRAMIQEQREALFMDGRRAQRAMERVQIHDEGAAPPKPPGPPLAKSAGKSQGPSGSKIVPPAADYTPPAGT